MENVNNIGYKGKKYIYSIGETYGLRKVIDFFNKNDRLYAKTVCVKCGKILHLDCEFMKEISEHIQKDHGFSLQCKNSILYGICRECQVKNV